MSRNNLKFLIYKRLSIILFYLPKQKLAQSDAVHQDNIFDK